MKSIRIPLTPAQEAQARPVLAEVERVHAESGARAAVFAQVARNEFAGGAHMRLRYIDPDTAAAVAAVMRARGYL